MYYAFAASIFSFSPQNSLRGTLLLLTSFYRKLKQGLESRHHRLHWSLCLDQVLYNSTDLDFNRCDQLAQQPQAGTLQRRGVPRSGRNRGKAPIPFSSVGERRAV